MKIKGAQKTVPKLLFFIGHLDPMCGCFVLNCRAIIFSQPPSLDSKQTPGDYSLVNAYIVSHQIDHKDYIPAVVRKN